MANPYPAVFRDDNSDTRLAGSIDFTDPANQPSPTFGQSIILGVAAGIDMHVSGIYNIAFSTGHDNVWDFLPLAAMPAGIGITYPLDGVETSLTTTVAGVWAFELNVVCPDDATATGDVETNEDFSSGMPFAPGLPRGAGGSVNYFSMFALPAGAAWVPRVRVTADATANPWSVFPLARLTRMA